MRRTLPILLVSALAIAGCGGESKLSGDFATCAWAGGTFERESGAAIREATYWLIDDGDWATLSKYDVAAEDAIPRLERSEKAAAKLEKAIWQDGAGGGSIRHGDTDQHLLVLIASDGDMDKIESTTAEVFEPYFDEDAEGKSFKTLREKHFHRYGANALVVGLDADGFTKRTSSALEECADKSAG